MRMPLDKHPQSGAEEYQRTRILTSGKVQAHIMLCERALNLMKDEANFTAEPQRKARNIIYQLQRGLNIQRSSAQDIYKSLAVVWDVIGTGTLAELQRATVILEDYHSLLRSVAGLNQAVNEVVNETVTKSSD